MERRLATTTGQMLDESFDARHAPAPLTSGVNRRRPNVSNRLSEHDNRNSIQEFGEYFGRGYGRRVVPPPTVYKHDWIFNSDARAIQPVRSTTQRDYRGWPSLTDPRTVTTISKEHYKSTGEWMKSSYDDFRRDSEQLPSELLYRNDYRRIPIHPWHY